MATIFLKINRPDYRVLKNKRPPCLIFTLPFPARGFGERCTGVQAEPRLQKHFWHTLSPENVPLSNNYKNFRLQKDVYLKLKTAINIIARTFQDIVHRLPGRGNFPVEIPGLSKRRRNPIKVSG